MGGRGSGGGKSGGGSKSNSQDLLPNETINKFSINNSGFINDINSKLKNMSDFQLEQQYSITEKAMNKAKTEYKKERDKLQKINTEFDNTSEGQKEYYQKMKEMDNQIKKVQIAQQNANMREQVHFLVVNEKFNVRGKKKK